jgi:hypothetical protein
MSMVELLVALVLFSIFGAIVFVQLSTNGRSLSALTDRLDAQSALWQGSDAFSAELRPASPGSGDILLATDSAVWYRGFVASAVVCTAPTSSTLELLPDSLASGMRPATGMASAQSGDLLYLFDEGTQRGDADDRWIPLSVATVSTVRGLCSGSPYLDPIGDVGRVGYRLRVQGGASIPATVGAGAAVRILRPARLALYRASTADWFLGWADWNTSLGAWNVVQPIAGKYRPYGVPPRPTGLGIGMRDSLNGALATPGPATAASRFELALRTQVLTRRLGVGPASVLRTDSLSTRVSLRNR